MYLGVDGGGTKTAFVLLDHHGTIRASHQGGSAFYLETGMETLRALLHEGIRSVLRSAGIGVGELSYAYFGIPVHGEDERTAELDRLPEPVLPRERYTCGNDMVCGWAGSLACEDGINVVAGTGSICYGEYCGRSARCGGWGELFSDEGSAYWIARNGLTLFSRMSDGRAERGPLYELVRQRLEGRADIELAAWAQAELNLGRSRFAALARLVYQAAERGDVQAGQIFERAAHELAQLVEATRRALVIPALQSVPVSYSGGVFGIGTLVSAPFTRALQATGSNYHLVAPRFSPVIGAALYAAKRSGHAMSAAALERLSSQAATQPLGE
ncbi:MAG TPA: BadF/BadG/BcrA/BcrD ATPase family protein [Steroidobacteraceae bacterium]|nr:BadF/BadG/BcrA/BcrD ATPase family protein [Steroidobacteraceae bacterium]